jgi:hypothetical protein
MGNLIAEIGRRQVQAANRGAYGAPDWEDEQANALNDRAAA